MVKLQRLAERLSECMQVHSYVVHISKVYHQYSAYSPNVRAWEKVYNSGHARFYDGPFTFSEEGPATARNGS